MLFAIMGTIDTTNSDNKSWMVASLDSDSYYERWSYILKDTTKISVTEYDDYASPHIEYITDAPYACLYYQYSYSTVAYEAAIVRFD